MHQKIQHFELRNKFNVDFALDSPEDIQRWREERKARFPKFQNNISNNSGQSVVDKSTNVGLKNKRVNDRHNHKKKRNRHKRKWNSNKTYDHCNIKRNKVEQELLTHNNITNDNCTKLDTSNTISTAKNSLSLISCYSSDDDVQNDWTTSKDDEYNLSIISELLNNVVSRVHNELTKPTNSSIQKCKKRKRPYNPHAHLSYSKLNLFQKVCIQTR